MNPLFRAKWIAPDAGCGNPVLIRRFYIGSMPVLAQLYIPTACYSEARINGKGVPAPSACSGACDVTALLIAGENRLEITPGPGHAGPHPVLYALELDCKRLFSDGSEVWYAAGSPDWPADTARERPVRILTPAEEPESRSPSANITEVFPCPKK